MPITPTTDSYYDDIVAICKQYNATLLAVSKTRSEKEIMALYQKGQRIFGENRAHELIIKASLLPTDIEWHLIGHLQSNKVNSVIRFVNCIQSLDSFKLWEKLNDEAKEGNQLIRCLLQIKIAKEDTKFGWDFNELRAVLDSGKCKALSNVSIEGVMGMASLTSDHEQIRREFTDLRKCFNELKENYFKDNIQFNILSMGMSSDYMIALEEGSTMLRIGSLLFNKK
ncbi:MAG TPA: YggS family pyridoxal phosphate-dependent enzyme [Saprospiraceae bacterium]|nr:YggS family pyridoxal phosphate-dependent enzyme [Saprospiraceae bacterium]